MECTATNQSTLLSRKINQLQQKRKKKNMKSPKRAFWNKKAKMNMARANNIISITLGFGLIVWEIFLILFQAFFPNIWFQKTNRFLTFYLNMIQRTEDSSHVSYSLQIALQSFCSSDVSYIQGFWFRVAFSSRWKIFLNNSLLLI